MATSRITNGERRGDPDDDLGYIPKAAIGHLAAGSAERISERRKEKRDARVESFIRKDFGFVPDSRGAITIAIDDIHTQINSRYNSSRVQDKDYVVGKFFRGLLARKSFTALDKSDLAEANSPIPDWHYEPTTFSVGNLQSNPRAMQAVAVHQLRASALATGDWSKLHSNMRDKSIEDELNFMSTLEPDQLEARWAASWESTEKELVFWSAKIQEAKTNTHVQRYLLAHPEPREQL